MLSSEGVIGRLFAFVAVDSFFGVCRDGLSITHIVSGLLWFKVSRSFLVRGSEGQKFNKVDSSFTGFTLGDK